MTFRRKIAATLVLVAVVPVAVIGSLAFGASRDEVTAVVERAQVHTTDELARSVEATVSRAVEGLTLSVQALPLERFSPAELKEVLRLPYRQVHGLTAIALLDANGDALVAPVFEPQTGRDAPALALLAGRVPLAAALSAGSAVGPAYRAPDGSPRVAIAIRVGGGVVVAELSLSAITERLQALSARGLTAVLLDGQGAPLAGAERLTPSESALAASPTATSRQIDREGGEPLLATFAPVPGLGWGVLLEQPKSVALGGARRLRDLALFWAAVGVALALSLGTWLARGLSRPLGELEVAAEALSKGHYDVELPAASGRDELARFAGTFREMTREIRRRDEEILAFNRELTARVEARTAELTEAQAQISRARRLAALGSMGAGVAHELNNPLTAITSLIDIVRDELPRHSSSEKMLGTAAEQAARMAEIVARLRALADAERTDAGRRFRLQEPVKAALQERAARLASGGVRVTATLPPDVPDVQGDAGDLQELVGHLVENALHAMPSGGKLDVAIEAVDGAALKLTVRDTGRGIAPDLRERIFDPFFTTKQDPSAAGVGLGLSSSHRIVERHHGKISVTSEVGSGSVFTVLLPAAGATPHLS